jgi:hypothetical protein
MSEKRVAVKDINTKLRIALIACYGAMAMQLKRESGEFHITAQTAGLIWNEAMTRAKEVLEETAE